MDARVKDLQKADQQKTDQPQADLRNKDQSHISNGGGAFRGLTSSLDELVLMYKSLLEVMDAEKNLLIDADTEGLIANNTKKEILLKKISGVEGLRIGFVGSISRELGMSNPTPRLLEIAEAYKMQAKGRSPEEATLKRYYENISELLDQVRDKNQANENLALSALKTVGGVLENIKETLSGKKTYQKKGQYKMGPEKSGNFVSKEA